MTHFTLVVLQCSSNRANRRNWQNKTNKNHEGPCILVLQLRDGGDWLGPQMVAEHNEAQKVQTAPALQLLQAHTAKTQLTGAMDLSCSHCQQPEASGGVVIHHLYTNSPLFICC